MAKREGLRDLPVHPPSTSVAEAGSTPASQAGPPSQVGNYRILDRIGVGGTGTVYRAEHVLLGRKAAVKVLRAELSDDPSYHELFLAEARAVNRVESEATVEVIDIGRAEDGRTYLVMELVEGWDLRDVLGGPIDVLHAMQVARQIAEALVAVHGAGFIHRDIKPENIYIVERDQRCHVKLLDFGVAAAMQGQEGPLPDVGLLIGTPEYMAPEQARGARIDHRTDLYALGALLYEMLTRQTPFEHSNLPQIIFEVTSTMPPKPSELVSLPEAVRDRLDTLVMRCLAKDPAKRPQTALEMADTLLAIERSLSPAPDRTLRDCCAEHDRDARKPSLLGLRPTLDRNKRLDHAESSCEATLRSRSFSEQEKRRAPTKK